MNRKISKKGFTLMEVLIAIGVIAIMCAIAIPAIVKANKTLNQTQANDYARSIYLAAQGNLTSKRTDGSLLAMTESGEYNSIYKDPDPTHPTFTLVDEFSDLNADVKAALADDEKKEYVYVVRSMSADEFSMVLPASSIDQSILSSGVEVTIIFNKETGDVFYVKYVTSSGVVGEYCGSIVNTNDLDAVPAEEIDVSYKIINGEECLLQLTVSIPDSAAANAKAFCEKLSFNFDIYKNSSNKYEYSYACIDPQTLKNQGIKDVAGISYTSNPNCAASYYIKDRAIFTWVIDSLSIGDLSPEKLLPDYDGSNMTLDFEIKYNGSQVKTITDTFNPFFESYNPSTKTVTISNGRNLQNLNIAKADIKNVKLSNDILWSTTSTYYYDKYHTFSGYKSVDNFTPISKMSGITFDGNGKTISDLVINASTGDAGLFQTLESSVVKSLTIKDAIVSGAKNVGTLAANIEGTKVEDCSVLLTPANNADGYGVKSTGTNGLVGLLVGSAAKTSNIKNAQVEANASVPASGTGFGLIAGSVSSTALDSCKVAASIEGGKANMIGLLVGNSEGSTISGCTAEGTIRGCAEADAKLDFCVGTIGYASNGTYSGNNTTLRAYAINYARAGGLIGCGSNASVSGNSVTFDLGDKNTANDIAGGYIGGLIGYAANCKVSGSDTKNTVAVDFTNFSNNAGAGGALGYADGGSYSGITVSGSFAGIVSQSVGGAVGIIDGGSFKDISTSVNMKLDYVWLLSDGCKTYGLDSSGGTYACPSSVGFAGKFVGFLSEGTLSDCSATGAGSGKRSTAADYSKMQFVGVVRPTQCTPSSSVYESLTKFTKTVDATEKAGAAGRYVQDGGSAEFFPAEKYWKYTGISLTNCRYTDANKKTYYQDIQPDRYYYTKGTSSKTGTQYKFSEITDFDYNDPTPFIILDDTREYAFVLNANYEPPVTLYTVPGLLDYFPKNSYTRDKTSTTPIYFFSNFNTNQTYVPVDTGLTGMIYEKSNKWPLYNTYIRETRFNIFDTYFVLNDTQLAETSYDHVVYDPQATFDFSKNQSTGEFLAMNTYNVRSGLVSYWSGIPSNSSDGSTISYYVKRAYVYTNTVRYELSALKVNLLDGESGKDIVIRDTGLTNALWRSVIPDAADYNGVEDYFKNGHALLGNVAYPSITRTLGGQTATDQIYLTIADNQRYASERGAYMTASMRFSRQEDVKGEHTTNWNSWRSDYNVRTLTIENHLDEDGDNYSTIFRNWNNNPFYLGMVGDTLYTKHASDISDPSFNHLHLYALDGSTTGETYNFINFTPADSPAQKISSSKA